MPKAKSTAGQEAGAGTGASESTKEEIGGAVDALMERKESERVAAEKSARAGRERDEDEREDGDDDEGGKGKRNLPPEESGDAGDENDPPEKKTKEKQDSPVITDAMLERAVKAGMSIEDARTFQSAEALDRICTRLEAKPDNTEKSGKKGDAEGAEDEDDPLKDIPELNPDEYDETLVKVMGGLRKIIKDQHATIKKLSGERSPIDADLWFTSKVGELGPAYHPALGENGKLDASSPQAAKRAELKEKFAVLTAGYKAAGKDVDPAVVFKEALAVVLPDVATKIALEEKGQRAERREKQRLNRPAGAQFRTATDPLAATAEDIDNRFFKKRKSA